MRRYRPGSGPVRAHGGVAVPDPFAMVRAYDSDSNPARPIRPSPLAASTIQGLPLDLLDRLRSFPLFQAAPDSFLTAVGLHLKPQLYQPHDTILTEGETGKAMYWLVRGAVRVTSRDQESTYAELKPGAFFGEIGILMDIPRTATIIANMRSLVVRLNKEDLMKELPKFPEVERAIMHEAQERLAILQRKKQELGSKRPAIPLRQITGKRDREDGDVVMAESGTLRDGEVNAFKKRKSPSPGLTEAIAHSAFGSGSVHVRPLLKELPLFSELPDDILHFIGMRAQPRSFHPFTDIIKQGTQGRDVFFIVKGEVEVINLNPPEQNGHTSPILGRRRSIAAGEHHFQEVKARLRAGQYFGEVVSLSLAPRRTATVRSVSSVECLMISGDTLSQFWDMCSPDLRRQVESVAKERLQTAKDNDVRMSDADSTPKIDELAIADIIPRTPRRKKSVPSVTFNDTPSSIDSPMTPTRRDEKMMEPFDPDPFLNVDLDNVRSRSRRGSLAPPTPGSLPESPSSPSKSEFPKSPSPNGSPLSPSPLPMVKHASTPPEAPLDYKRPRMIRRPSRYGRGKLPDPILTDVFKYLDIYELMKLREISWHWHKVISASPDILHDLDLTKYNRRVTDRTLVDIICPFVGGRPKYINISNCFHVTDEGFAELAKTCAPGVKIWRMKSVWDITGPAVLEMVQKAKGLEEVDLSNCRKVGDNLLARVIGWVVPELPPQMALAHAQHQAQMNGRRSQGKAGANGQQAVPQPLPPGTVVGCPKLRRLTLSYCKHITDRSMAHIAVHAANRIESIDLTRCTTITDVGFQHWSVYPFPRLTRLCLADCTYLTDNAIVYLTNAAKGLKELDLSFCCALSDTATEVLALGLPSLTHLNLAFCGSAVSDTSLRCISLHLLELRNLSVRGCVRVTGTGVEAVVEGCRDLELFDVSQCKNLGRWLDAGGVDMVRKRGRHVVFETVADGRWRAGRKE
ncbi:cyclic nucleotide-binding domain-containing protein [Pyrenochaeta sp. MPI-SDFR-AT-0127]|nr:cyclic nucleotide-binding domain-containing protein [Pyrenochaeta sp. MPI-SDFR-AT-0127]